jgi:dienelactone hydrolase
VTTIVIFHSVLGLRPVEQDAAERFRSDGFDIALPDLYAGKHTESLDKGFHLMAEIGWPVICQRASDAINTLPESTILAGFSMGTGVIADLWHQRPESKAVLLFHGLAKIPENVRPGLKVQTHTGDVDPFVSPEQRTLWAQSAQTASLLLENHNYPDTAHFFTDLNSIDYNAAASELAWKRALDLLHRL